MKSIRTIKPAHNQTEVSIVKNCSKWLATVQEILTINYVLYNPYTYLCWCFTTDWSDRSQECVEDKVARWAMYYVDRAFHLSQIKFEYSGLMAVTMASRLSPPNHWNNLCFTALIRLGRATSCPVIVVKLYATDVFFTCTSCMCCFFHRTKVVLGS